MLTMTLAFTMNAQPITYSGTVTVTSTNTDTDYLYPIRSSGDTITFDQIGVLTTTMTADSLTGTTAGTGTLQYSESTAGTVWHDIATVTANGTTTVSTSTTTNPIVCRRIRMKCSTTGTQTTKWVLSYAWMNLEPR